jgi:hypothetical protein
MLDFMSEWFYGKDIVIDIISTAVLILIAFFAFRYYRMDKNNKRFLYFVASFGLMAVAFIFKILTHFNIYYHTTQTKQIGAITLAYSTVKVSEIWIYCGFIGYWFLMLLGLYLLYSVYLKDQAKSSMLLIGYLLFIVSLYSTYEPHVFHITCLILLSIITFIYLGKYNEEKNRQTMGIAISFLIIALSQASFVFFIADSFFYEIGEIIQIVGYIILLFTFVKVLKHAKKKR